MRGVRNDLSVKKGSHCWWWFGMAIVDIKVNPINQGPSNMTFAELEEELTRQLETKKDFIVADANVSAFSDGEDIILEIGKFGEFPMTKICHQHTSQNLNIPKKYYDRMMVEEPELLVKNINAWLEKSQNVNIVRTMDNKARAWVSGGYGFFDNYDFFYTISKAVMQLGGTFMQIYLDEHQLIMKAVRRDLEMEMPRSDLGTVFPALFFQNSEVRYRKLTVSPMLIFVNCWNGSIGENCLAKIHRGKRQLHEGILSHETIRLQNKAFWSEVRDLAVATFKEENYKLWIKKISKSTEYALDQPTKVLEGAIVTCEIPESEKQKIMDYFTKQSEITQFGAVQALTWYAHEQDNVDRQVQIEVKAGKLLLTDGSRFERMMVHASEKDEKLDDSLI